MNSQRRSYDADSHARLITRKKNVVPARIIVAFVFVAAQVSTLFWFHSHVHSQNVHVHHANNDAPPNQSLAVVSEKSPKTSNVPPSVVSENENEKDSKKPNHVNNDAPANHSLTVVNKNESETHSNTSNYPPSVVNEDGNETNSKKRNYSDEYKDGYFNNFPLKKNIVDDVDATPSFYSSVHCSGDNFDKKNSWQCKTCHFRNLCFDTKSHEFVLISSEKQDMLEGLLANTSLTYASVSTAMKHDYNSKNPSENNEDVGIRTSIGGINPKWAGDVDAVKWFPIVKSYKNESFSEELRNRGVYVVPSDVVMFPYHSFAGHNPGHLLWDDFLPMHTLLQAFDLLDHRIMFLRHVFSKVLWASCDRQHEKCHSMMEKFMPLMGVNFEENYSSIHDFDLRLRDDDGTINDYSNTTDISKQPYICASNGVSGMGMATDHGVKLHGWAPSDFEYSHNMNRGSSLYDFRNFMLNNVKVSTKPLRLSTKKHKIVFSINSSSHPQRSTRFEHHRKYLTEKLEDKYELDIETARLSDLSAKLQAKLLSETSIFVTMCGGGSASGVFLPRGASIIIFFNEWEGNGETPARLDWDFFNHANWLRTHWLPRPKKKHMYATDLELFVKLIDHELDIITNLKDL